MEAGIALGISIGALVISIIVPIFEYLWNRKMNERNLSSEYFKALFSDIIYVELPKAREYIHFNGQEITGTDSLENVMRLLRQKMIYFKKSNPDFYNSLIQEIQNFENLLITKSGKADSGAFASFYNEVDEYIEKIYTYINKMYLGKRIRRKER